MKTCIFYDNGACPAEVGPILERLVEDFVENWGEIVSINATNSPHTVFDTIWGEFLFNFLFQSVKLRS